MIFQRIRHIKKKVEGLDNYTKKKKHTHRHTTEKNKQTLMFFALVRASIPSEICGTWFVTYETKRFRFSRDDFTDLLHHLFNQRRAFPLLVDASEQQTLEFISFIQYLLVYISTRASIIIPENSIHLRAITYCPFFYSFSSCT